MTESGHTGDVHGERTLAAILFTDVVSFSALVQADEERTLLLAQRDMEYMRAACGRAGGQVLKSTGDGLLMVFTSAIQAVQCALEIQRHFTEAAETAAPEDVMQHRIGIHLGDVYVDGTDVMGDGVNIAARIQGEAEPDGICVSQTVHDVVKNRIGVQTTYLGPRELKNIREAVPVYRILLAAQNGLAPAAAPAGRRRRALWLAGAAVAAVLIAGGVWLALRGGGETAPPAPGPPVEPVKRTAVTVEIASMPKDAAEFEAMCHQHAKTPEGAVACFLIAVLLHESKPELAMEFIPKILGPGFHGPSGRVTPMTRMMLARLARDPQIARSYVVGASPDNDYQLPPPPYRIRFEREPEAQDQTGRVQIYLVSTGADTARPVKLIQVKEGFWRLERMSSLSVGVRPGKRRQ